MASDPYLRLKVTENGKRTNVSFGRADLDTPTTPLRDFLWNIAVNHRSQLEPGEIRLFAQLARWAKSQDTLAIKFMAPYTLKILERLAPDADLQLLEHLDQLYPGQFDHIK